MSVRQYIGARYVPRFSTVNDGVWDNSYSYEALEIVKYGNDYYTSKKPVPTGVAITNTEYWALTGNYNGAIAGLDTRLTSAENDINKIETVVGYTAGRYIFIGDSYNNPEYSGWGNYAATALGLSSSQYASLFVNGGSFVNNSFATPITNYANTLSAAEKLEVTNVVFLGGINDASTGGESAIITNIRAWILQCKGLFPNAKISIGFIGNSVETSSILNGRDYKNISMALNIYRHVGDWGAYYLSGMEYILHDYSLMSSDGIHPTLQGGNQIGQWLAIALKEGGVHICSNYTTTNKDDFIDNTANVDAGLSVVNLATADNQFLLNINRNDSIQSITYFGRFAVNTIGGAEYPYIQVNPSQEFNIGKIKAASFISGKDALRIPVVGAGKDYNEPSVYHPIKGTLKIKGGLIKLKIEMVDNDWNANKAVTQMLYSGFTVCNDTLLF